jgi:hypothetical protein
MFSLRTREEDDMNHSLRQIFANACGALLIGLFFAMVGLNAASGCGDRGGQCIGIKDFVGHSEQVASR